MKTKKVLTRNDFKEICKVAPSCWQSELRRVGAGFITEDEIELSEDDYKKARNHNNDQVNAILDRIYGKEEDKYRMRRVFSGAVEQDLVNFCSKAFADHSVIQILHGVAENDDERLRGLWMRGKWEIREKKKGVIMIPIKD